MKNKLNNENTCPDVEMRDVETTSHTSMNFTRKLTANPNEAWFRQIDADASYTNT